MRRMLSRLYNSPPKEWVRVVMRKTSASAHDAVRAARAREVADQMRALFDRYKTANLKGVKAAEFAAALQSKIDTVDAAGEGYAEYELDRQRDLSVKFHWGHNHDFGDFKLQGRMDDRHIELMANFVSLFPVSVDDFRDKYVFDVGCWTGGTTLLLAALANKVLAIEEVRKYAETVDYLVRSFGIDNRVEVHPLSVYECNDASFYDRFDIVYFPGVIYHLSDPLLALRILFNSLKVGGLILVETAGINNENPLCQFDGSLVYYEGTKERLNRGGWNWFLPSPSALYRLMKEAGFDEVQTCWHDATGRVYGYGRKVAQQGICKAGLALRDIR